LFTARERTVSAVTRHAVDKNAAEPLWPESTSFGDTESNDLVVTDGVSGVAGTVRSNARPSLFGNPEFLLFMVNNRNIWNQNATPPGP
jgi:hypothetical protein